MASTFTSILLHIVFSMKNRANLIAPAIEAKLHKYIAGIISNLQCRVLVIGGTASHVHMLVSMAKATTVVALLETVKKESSKWVKTQGPQFASFYWQEGYAALSIGQSGAEALRAHINNQKAHHGDLSFEDELVALLKKYDISYDERYIWG